MGKASLMHIFPSPCVNRVLEIVFSHYCAVSLRHIAKLTPFTPRAVQKALQSLLRKKLLKRYGAGQFHLYYPNEALPEVGLIRHILRAKQSYVPPLEEKRFIARVDEALLLSSSADRMRFPGLKLPGRDLVLERVAGRLREVGIDVILSGSFSSALYRSEIRAFSKFEFLTVGLLPPLFLRSIVEVIFSLMPPCEFRKSDDAGSVTFTFSKGEKVIFEFCFSKVVIEPNIFRLSHPRFGRLCFLRVEEVILKLCLAISEDEADFLSLDDLQGVFQSKPTLDSPTLSGLFTATSVRVPKNLEKSAPSAVRDLIKYLNGRSMARLAKALS